MPTHSKVKPNNKAQKEPLRIPDGSRDIVDDVWYPPEWFVIEVHDAMIERIGGWKGLDVGLAPYQHFLEEVKAAEGIYLKAAILLKDIATSRMFQDGHHRTAYIVTKTFLEKNDAEFAVKAEHDIIRFIKDIRKYSIKEIKGWIQNGELQRSDGNSP
jgi:prophage maintenance system killer protein